MRHKAQRHAEWRRAHVSVMRGAAADQNSLQTVGDQAIQRLHLGRRDLMEGCFERGPKGIFVGIRAALSFLQDHGVPIKGGVTVVSFLEGVWVWLRLLVRQGQALPARSSRHPTNRASGWEKNIISKSTLFFVLKQKTLKNFCCTKRQMGN